MVGKNPSKQQEEARAAQSLADRTGRNKEAARDMQSDADRAAVPKHGQ